MGDPENVGTKLTSNVAIDNGGFGLVVRADGGSVKAARVTDNIVARNGGFHGIVVFSPGGDIQAPKLLNNVVSNNASNGITLFADTDLVKAQLKGNVSTENTNNGIELISGGETSRANLTQNVATSNGEAGFRLTGTRGRVVRNTASGNQRGILFYGDATSNRIERNVTDGNTIVGIVTESGSIQNKLNRNEGRGNGDDDFFDANADCGSNVWRKNQFGSSNEECIQ